MIRNDYIYDHGLELPDLCDFPGAGESLYPIGINFDHVANVRYAFELMDIGKFRKAWIEMVEDIRSHIISFNPQEEKILGKQNSKIFKSVKLYFESCKGQVERTEIPATPLFNTLDHDGCVGFHGQQKILDDIRSHMSSEIEELLAIEDHVAKPHDYDRFYLYNEAQNEKLFHLVRQLFNDKGVFDAVTKYNRTARDMDLNSIALHVATPTDTHHYMTLRDLSATSELVSLHMDPKYNLMKAMVYLNEVDKDTGPFTTLPTSNRWAYDQLQRLVACGNSTGNYLDNPVKRKVMRCFPPEFRKNVILGRYIQDGTLISSKMLGMLHEWTSDEADCIIFDPTQTLHRGGLCKNKKRVNLQILMR